MKIPLKWWKGCVLYYLPTCVGRSNTRKDYEVDAEVQLPFGGGMYQVWISCDRVIEKFVVSKQITNDNGSESVVSSDSNYIILFMLLLVAEYCLMAICHTHTHSTSKSFVSWMLPTHWWLCNCNMYFSL